jgi:ATP-dependent phosphoenolpyruvate carboxykinase
MWGDKPSYDSQASDLAARFEANFRQFDASPEIRSAAPAPKAK